MNINLAARLVKLANTRGSDTAYQYFYDDQQPCKTLTYAQLDERAKQIARHLQEHFSQGDRALLLFNSGFEFVEAFFACMYAGIVAVPVYPPKKNQNIDRLRTIVVDAGAKGALTTEKINEIARPLFEAEPLLADLAIFTTDAEPTYQINTIDFQHCEVAADELAFLQYTSGSTGEPKGVMVSQANILDNQEMMKQAFGHDHSTGIVSWLPHFHDMGLIFGILHPIYIGAPAALMNPTYFLQKPYRWLKLLSDTKAVTSSAPNFAYDLCVDTVKDTDLKNLDLSHWRSALNGAEPVRATTLERFVEKFKGCGFRRDSISPCYGMAETTLFASGGKLSHSPTVLRLITAELQTGKVTNVTHGDDDSFCDLHTSSDNSPYYAVSCGITWHNHTMAIVNTDTNKRCADGETGEIWIKGASVAQGYWGKAALTKEIFQAYVDDNDGPYLRTGDLGFVYRDELFVTGRSKDVLIFRGKNYYPQDIELTVSNANAALDNNGGAAFSIMCEQQERLVIVQQVKRTAVRKLDPEAICKDVIQAITEQHGITPYDVVLIKPGRVLKTSSGKIQRQENKRHYLAQQLTPLYQLRGSFESETFEPQSADIFSSHCALEDEQHANLLSLLQSVVAQEVDMDPQSLAVDASFQSLGVDSMKAVRISGELMELHDIELEPTVLYDYPSISKLANYLWQFAAIRTAAISSNTVTMPAAIPTLNEAAQSLRDCTDKDIAIIGMACRYPEAESIEAFWQLLCNQQDAIGLPNESRGMLCPHLDNTRLGGYISDIEQFDANLFGISPTEAKHIDPQHRLLLETSYHAIEAAGYAPMQLSGVKVGVYIGISQNDYFLLSQQYEKQNAYLGTGTALSIAANRLSYYYNFSGPSVAVDTACSSSLVALHLAMQSIHSGEIAQALVGGVNLILSDEVTNACENAQMLAKDGRCKTFSDSADGYVRSEGVGCLLLKSLAQAVQDNDPIYGVLKGSAVNQDGRSNGITAPNGLSQQSVIKSALANAQIAADDVQYVEAHGTGTELGDPIEVSALSKVYRPQTSLAEPLTVGAVKANIGHLESGAGIAGVIKTMLCMQHKKIPGQAHAKELNKHIAWHKIALKINRDLQPWPVGSDNGCIAGVSSFGFGGTNAHIICASAPQRAVDTIDLASQTGFYLLPLSAKTPDALANLLTRYETRLKSLSDNEFDALIYTAAHLTKFKEAKRAVCGEDRAGLLRAMRGLNTTSHLSAAENDKAATNYELVMLFTGQGSQYPAMAKQLYDTQIVFKNAIDECDHLLGDRLGESLLTVLYQQSHKQFLEQTNWTQVGLFAVEYATAKLMIHFGATPKLLLGHSVGEYAAACIAQVFSLADAILLIAARGQLMHELADNGGMFAVRCSEQVAQQVITKCHDNGKTQIAISAYHGASGVVFSGENSALEIAIELLKEQNLTIKQLNTARAFHSPLMDPMLDDFAAIAAQVNYRKPCYPLLSSVTGQLETDALATPQYWIEQITKPVRIDLCVSELDKREHLCAVEVGPKPVLMVLLQENLPHLDAEYLPILHSQGADKTRLVTSLGRIFELGIELNWAHIYPQINIQKQPLPAYPFAKNAHWIVPTAKQPALKSTAMQENMQANKSVTNINQVVARTELIRDIVLSNLANLLSLPVDAIKTNVPLLEMGVDSLMIMQAVRTYEREFGLEFSVRQFYEELSTVDSLLDYIAQHSDFYPHTEDAQLTSDIAIVEQNTPSYSDTTTSSANMGFDQQTIMAICQQQLQAAASVTNDFGRQSIAAVTAQQLRFLQGSAITSSASVTPDNMPQQQVKTVAMPVNKRATELPASQSRQLHMQHQSPAMQQHFEQLKADYCAKTSASKKLVAQHRGNLADCRASAGFRLSSKEMLYPIYADHCEQARLWDIDGNEYIDITMDFGVNLFGHKAEFVTDALAQQVDQGIQLGLASPLACEVAALISELTGLARVTFCNSGTEAVMTALRLARNYTKRDKIVQFSGAYHGHYDGTLAHSVGQGDIEPMCAGVRQGAVNDNLVLDYGSAQALEIIRANAHTIAAVLVEPVQSRYPEIQPWEFLKELRAITTEHGIALIFDEMITGFRAHPGGVQGLVGIQADMATYGKIVGGGLPIGVVAGSADYLDGIDGGVWQYGDQSYPQADTTFFAGTFCKHPMAMASAKAVLSEIKRQGPQLQQRLSDKTNYLKTTLNRFFADAMIPIQIEAFSSLFRFRFSQNLDMFFYEMLNRGIFIWEGRNCFLSAAHTDADIEIIITAVKDSALSLKVAGYFGIERDDKMSLVTLAATFPLTEAQQQLLALASKSPEGAFAYHLQAVLKLTGQLDISRLVTAVDKTVRECTILQYAIDSDTLCHRLVAEHRPQLLVINLQHSDNNIAVATQLQELRYHAFDFNNEVACRFALLRENDNTAYLSVVTHHLLCDGVSLQIILSKVGQHYNNTTTEALAAQVDFSAYVKALDHYKESANYQQDKAFWLAQLAPSMPLQLPTNTAIATTTNYAVSVLTVELNEHTKGNIADLAKQQGCGQFATLLGLYIAWLSKLSQQSMITVGIPCSDRQLLPQADSAESSDSELVGYCTNILPICIDVTNISSVRELIKTVQSELLTAFEHQHFPYSALANESLNLPNTLFNLDKVTALPAFTELQLNTMPSNTCYSQFQLSCNLTQFANSWSLTLEYQKDKFTYEQVNHWLSGLIGLFSNAVGTDELNSANCSLLDDLQIATLVTEQCERVDKQLCVDSCIVSFEYAATQYPDNIAITCDGQSLNYSQLNQRVNTFAHYLIEQGIGVGSLVAIALPRRAELIISLLAVLKTGAAFLPLDITFPQARIEYILADAQADLLLCDSFSDSSPIIASNKLPVLDIDTVVLTGLQSSNPDRVIAPLSTAYVIYTSGSTGQPKGVEINHQGLQNLLLAMTVQPGIEPTDCLLAVTTIAFDIAMLELFSPLIVGANVLLASEQTCSDPYAITDLIAHFPVSIMQATPTLWRLIINAAPDCLAGIKVLCGGEPLDPALAQAVLSQQGDLWNMYGPTETTIWSAISHIQHSDDITIGSAIANTSLYVMAEDAQSPCLPLPIGVWGELWIGGLGLATGYLQQPALTAERFVSHVFNGQSHQRLYKTGDRARRLLDGRIELQGRLDQQVKLNGHRIELSEIEHHLRLLFANQDVRVFIKPNNHDQPSLCAYSLEDDSLESVWSVSELRRVLSQSLPSYMVPESICWLTQWPTTPNGKLDTKALPLPTAAMQSAIVRIAPSCATETSLLQHYLALLKVAVLGTQESFFDCGGNSVLAMQLVSRINLQFKVRVTVGDIFDYPSVAQLALRIDDLLSARAASTEQSQPQVTVVSDIVSGRDISKALDDSSMTEMDL